MSETRHNSLTRLRAANPVGVRSDLGHGAAAQAILHRILSEPPAVVERRRKRGWRSRGPGGSLGVALAAVVIGGGAAFAATDPFGWISASPDTARYEVNQAVHVRVPYIDQIACQAGRGGEWICSPRGSGQRYMRTETVAATARASLFSRAGFTAAIARAQEKHLLSSAQAAKFRHDLARVPDSFFLEFRLAMHYQTISTEGGRVPPVGVPEWVVCQGTRSALTCQDLNGDPHVPVGAAIYQAQVAPDWRPAPRTRSDYRLPPGINFTPTEERLLVDVARAVSTGGGVVRRSLSRPAP